MYKIIISLFFMTCFLSCSTHPHVIEEIKYIGFDDYPKSAKSIGLVRGESCSKSFPILEFFTRLPTGIGEQKLQNALKSLQTGTKDGLFDIADQGLYGKKHRNQLKGLAYATEVRMSHEQTNYFIFASQCVILEGEGFQ